MTRKKGKQRKKIRKSQKARKPIRILTKGDRIPLIAVLVATAIMFARTAGYDFVNWDDDFNIAKNPNLRYFDWANVKAIFSSHVIGNYNPLAILTFALEKHFFGLDPSVFHINNVILHVICVFLVYRLSRQLGLSSLGAAFVAMLFGLHPMRVESVAWITERKDVLYSAFFLAALGQYVSMIRAKGKKRTRHMLWLIVFFVLSLFSKIQAVALPLSMLAVDYLLKRPLVWKRIYEKWIYFGLSLVFGVVGVVFLSEQGSLDASSHLSFLERMFIGIYSFDIYLIKYLVPFRMSPLYPYPAELPWYIFASPVMLLGLAYLVWMGLKRGKAWRPFVFGIAFFTFNVMFVLQVVGAGQGFLADRFTYMPYLGLMFATGYYLLHLVDKYGQRKKLFIGIAALWAAGLLVQTWRHIPLWRNSETLWTHVLKYYDATPLPFRNRAQYYRDAGEHQKALQDYNKSISLREDDDVINSRARLHFTLGDYQKALVDYNRAIELNPNSGEFFINRGATYANLGNMQQALQDMTRGIELDPDFLNGYSNRSLVYQSLGQFDKAQQDIQKYLSLNPYNADMWYESARLHRRYKDEAAALSDLNMAIKLDQSKGVFWYERSKCHLTLGDRAQAQSDLSRAEQLGVQVDPQIKSQYR